MKTEPKAFASLSSGLLARKGAARPAMRPQGFGPIGGAGLEDLGWNDMGFEPPKPEVVPIRDEDHDAFGEELPTQPLRNPIAALTPVGSPVHDQQAEIEDRLVGDGEDDDEEIDETAELYEPENEPDDSKNDPAPVLAVVPAPAPAPVSRRPRKPRAVPGAKGKAAFTLRLDPERHLKLRLACAVGNRSAQLLVTDALDAFLASMPELETMARKAKQKE